MSPAGKNPHLSALREFLTPERLALIKNDPERVALVKEISKMLARNPAFMKSVESMSREQESEVKNLLSPEDAKSFGWEDALKPPSPAQAAAAAAILAAAIPVPV
jgi:hypothetical protein